MKGKLELTWAGKDEPLLVEPRILLYDDKNSYGAQDTGNMLIHGDNLLALKALEQKFAGQVKCVYIDPPYNTGSAFEHYDDNFEHSTWLNLMKCRLEILRNLLSTNGFIFVQIDNYEMAYLKILLDEIFGRNCFINDIVWKRKGGSVNPRNKLNNNTDYILWYSKVTNADIFPVYTKDDPETLDYIKKRFKYTDEDGRIYRLSPIISPTYSPTLVYEYKGYKSPQNGWSLSRSKMEEFEREGRLYMPENKAQRIQRKQFLDEYKGRPIGNLWTDINVINPMSQERLEFTGQKPEILIKRCLELTTNPGDLVLDSFLGSGTTAAVAHKMNRRYIGIEMGEHAYTHCKVRLDKVIDGEDAGGITKAVNWQGGGGYRFYELAGTLVKLDDHGEHIISPEYDAEKLAAAVALHENYTYSPDKNCFWKQAKGSDNSFLFTTTRHISAPFLDSIAQRMKPEEFLTVMTTSFAPELNKAFKNITLKDIPDSLLKKCAFDVDNYNLPIVDPPTVTDDLVRGQAQDAPAPA